VKKQINRHLRHSSGETYLAQWAAYVVKNERLSLNLAILDIDSLHMHEETIPELVEQLAWSVKAEGRVKHPIIVDTESLVVLDGVHRVAALKKLRIKRIPACLVDYKNPNIKVCSWYRTITGAAPSGHILKQVERTGNVVREIRRFDESSIGVPPTVAAIRFRHKAFLIDSSFQNLKEAYDIIGRIEERMKRSGLRIKYETESDALENLRKGRVNAVLCTPRLGKKEIVEAAISGQVLASKATRHIIPARLMNLNVPLNFLRDDKRLLSEVNEKLNHMLQKKHLKRLPPGRLLDGRRYEEELYIFEE